MFMRYCIYNIDHVAQQMSNNSLICLEVQQVGITARSDFKHFNLSYIKS